MVGLDESRTFVPLNIAVLTVTNTRTFENDTSGDLLQSRVLAAGHHLHERLIVADKQHEIEAVLRKWIDTPSCDVVVSTGGTGLTGHDVTTEAFFAVYHKEIPGFGELFRMLSYKIIGTSTIQSRATAGVAKNTLLFALPGSTNACRDGWDLILGEQLDARYGPCNFVEILPRLTER